MSDNQFVTADAQFGNAKLLRPAANYESIYQGNAFSPILLAENGLMLDPRAGESGYSNWLARGIPVPFGARIMLWFPAIIPQKKTPALVGVYQWKIMWRMRNLYDFRQSRIPFHIPKQSDGEASTLAGDTGARVLIPAAAQTEIVSNANGIQSMYQEIYEPSNILASLPLLAVGQTMNLEQGVFDPGSPPPNMSALSVSSPQWQLVEVQAQGDEMLLMVTRLTLDSHTDLGWDFVSGVDHIDSTFGNFFRASDSTGVYVLAGSTP